MARAQRTPTAAQDHAAATAAVAMMTEREQQRRAEERARHTREQAARKQQVRHLLDSRERYAIVCALRLAAERYEADSADMARAGMARLVEQFDAQARDARDVLDWMED